MKPTESQTWLAKALLDNRLKGESRSAQARRFRLSEGILRQIEHGHLLRDHHKIEAFAKGVRRSPKFVAQQITQERIRRLQRDAA